MSKLLLTEGGRREGQKDKSSHGDALIAFERWLALTDAEIGLFRRAEIPPAPFWKNLSCHLPRTPRLAAASNSTAVFCRLVYNPYWKPWLIQRRAYR